MLETKQSINVDSNY